DSDDELTSLGSLRRVRRRIFLPAAVTNAPINFPLLHSRLSREEVACRRRKLYEWHDVRRFPPALIEHGSRHSLLLFCLITRVSSIRFIFLRHHDNGVFSVTVLGGIVESSSHQLVFGSVEE